VNDGAETTKVGKGKWVSQRTYFPNLEFLSVDSKNPQWDEKEIFYSVKLKMYTPPEWIRLSVLFEGDPTANRLNY
jgi:hypothetical protein